MGSGGERSARAGRDIAGLARQWSFPASHRGGFGGITRGAGSLTGATAADPSKGRWPEEDTTQRPGSSGGSGKAAGADDERGSAIAASVDVQKRAESGHGTASSGTSGESHAGGGTTAPTEIQSPGES